MDIRQKLELMEQEKEANKRHFEEWKKQMTNVHSFYFTFGTDPLFPYGYHDYVLIICRDESEACKLFNTLHPKRLGSNVMNCAFMYNETQWELNTKKYYAGRDPVETIIVTRTRNR